MHSVSKQKVIIRREEGSLGLSLAQDHRKYKTEAAQELFRVKVVIGF